MKKTAKAVATMAVAAALMGTVSVPAFAAGWQKNDTGWWWQNDDGSYPVSQWQWLDGNGDGIAESYCFDASGYMYANTTTPDGYQVNADGQWLANGAVQTKAVQASTPAPANNTQNGTYSTSEYDNNGISLAALDMLGRTRAENAKYGEESVGEGGTCIYVTYKNGLVITYDFDGGYNGVDTEIRTGWSDVRNIFRYADLGTDDKDLVRILKKKGYDCYTNDNVWVKNLKSNVTSKTYILYVYSFDDGHRAIVFSEQDGVY